MLARAKDTSSSIFKDQHVDGRKINAIQIIQAAAGLVAFVVICFLLQFYFQEGLLQVIGRCNLKAFRGYLVFILLLQNFSLINDFQSSYSSHQWEEEKYY